MSLSLNEFKGYVMNTPAYPIIVFFQIQAIPCNTNLSNHCAYPDPNKDRIPLEPIDHVALAVDLTCVDLIEECHHDEGVEDDGEMLWRRRVKLCPAAIVNVK